MAARRTGRRRWLAFGACGLVALGWFLWLRPTALGGAASYVVVDGTSMEPTYDDGDLVLIRKASHYEEGDIIAFRAGGPADDPRRVIHRIVGQSDDGAFVTQGDNRDRVDPVAPFPDEVIGRAVLHIPRVGSWAHAVGRPQVLAALGGAAIMVGEKQRRRRRMTSFPSDVPPPRSTSTGPQRARRNDGSPPRWLRHTEPRWAFLGLLLSVALLLPVLLVTWSAMRAPDSGIRVESVGQVQLGVDIDYRLIGDASPVYPEGVVTTEADASGARVPTDTLYSRLLHRLEVALAFRMSAQGAQELKGTYDVQVTLAMPDGWSTVLTSIEPTPVDGFATQLVGVDLRAAAATVAQITELTGVGGEDYTITVAPRLDVEGTADGRPLDETVVPTATFVVSGGLIKPEPVQSADDSRQIGREVRHGVDYGLGPVSLDTQAARGILGGLALVLLATAGVCAAVLFGGLGLAESERIAARYRSQIVDVAAATGPPGPVVMVSGIEELARMAKVDQSVILHEDLGDGSHRYRVFLGAVTYEYETAPEHGGGAVDADLDSSSDQPGT
jgi:signal peptidase I